MTILLILAAFFFVFWFLGLIIRITTSGLIHIALVIAVILLIVWLMKTVLRVF